MSRISMWYIMYERCSFGSGLTNHFVNVRETRKFRIAKSRENSAAVPKLTHECSRGRLRADSRHGADATSDVERHRARVGNCREVEARQRVGMSPRRPPAWLPLRLGAAVPARPPTLLSVDSYSLGTRRVGRSAPGPRLRARYAPARVTRRWTSRSLRDSARLYEDGSRRAAAEGHENRISRIKPVVYPSENREEIDTSSKTPTFISRVLWSCSVVSH